MLSTISTTSAFPYWLDSMATQVSETAKQFLGVESFPNLETVQTLTVPPGTTFVMIQAQGNPALWHPGGSDVPPKLAPGVMRVRVG